MDKAKQDELKQWVGRAAADHVLKSVPEGAVVGVGTGSTVNCFIDALAPHRARYRGAVSSSLATTHRLKQHGFHVIDANDIASLPIYVDGADEIDAHGNMIKGGGGALTREKIVAAMSETFLCIADESKRVPVLGGFPLPVEVVPMALEAVSRKLIALGGTPVLRVKGDGTPLVTDNGLHILDVKGLRIDAPLALERQLNDVPGVLTVGVFALQRASLAMFATAQGVETVAYPTA
ncbi:ribose-5-phosphate isomerase RpiA [Robbsia sp. KACC 23696]|uniref:ribose-5-phosphate isomerase RpiA n=1 Tax=Robbsia sp. KACC 23696 TaxID=3149231 RepID=UPI00325B998A